MKRTIISASVLALAVAGTGLASAEKPASSGPSTYKVTGGGQTLVPEGGGAGDTVAFTAQQIGSTEQAEVAKGQFQYQDRNEPTGSNAQGKTLHGEVTCVLVSGQTAGESGGTAVVGGYLRDGVTAFRVDVTDLGNGAGSDTLLVRFGTQASNPDGSSGDTQLCDSEDTDTAPASLQRGNVKVHKSRA